MLDHYERMAEDLGEASVFSHGTAASTYSIVGPTVSAEVDAQSVDAALHIERLLKDFLARHYPEHTYAPKQGRCYRYRHGGVIWLSITYYVDADGYDRKLAHQASLS